MFIDIVNLTNFDQLLNSSYWQFVVDGHRANEPCLSRVQLANMRVLINDGSNWETFSVLLKPGQRLLNKHAIGWR